MRMSRNTANVACGACGGRAGKWVSGEVAVHLGPPVLDKVERSWSCWRHPNASGVGLKVAGAMETVEPHKAQSDFLEGGCGTVGTPRRTGRESVLYCELRCCKNATRENAYHEKTHTF